MAWSLDYAVVALGLGLALLLSALWRPYRTTTSIGTSVSDKRKEGQSNDHDRAPGEWTPVPFSYPHFEPWLDYDIDKTLPLPYRPFKWGAYHVTMGLRTMRWPEWIELDKRYLAIRDIKVARTLSRGEKIVRTLPPRPGVPGGAAAAKELVFELAEFLSRRYPHVFKVSRLPHEDGDYGWYGEGQIHTIEIVPASVKYDLTLEDPLTMCGFLVPDDIIIMVEGSDGRYYFQAGSVCLAGSWKPEDKFGKPLEQIHTDGHVPQYESKLQLSMARYFRKLKPNAPILRHNYGFQMDGELAWSSASGGDEDTYGEGARHRPDFKPREKTVGTDVTKMYFRTERQTLRRLPRSGAAAFVVRTYLEPVVALAEEPGVPGRMASAIRSWPEDIAIYKGQAVYKDALLPYLDAEHAKQLAAGIVAADDRTSDYPF